MKYRNEVTITGQIDREPDLRRFDSGTVNCTLSVLTRYGANEAMKTWHRVVVWDSQAEMVSELPVGTWINILGYLKTRSWQGADGQKRYMTEVVATTVDVLESSEQPEAGAEPPPDDTPEVSDADLPF
jgi:single-strand DNA-binding protein